MPDFEPKLRIRRLSARGRFELTITTPAGKQVSEFDVTDPEMRDGHPPDMISSILAGYINEFRADVGQPKTIKLMIEEAEYLWNRLKLADKRASVAGKRTARLRRRRLRAADKVVTFLGSLVPRRHRDGLMSDLYDDVAGYREAGWWEPALIFLALYEFAFVVGNRLVALVGRRTIIGLLAALLGRTLLPRSEPAPPTVGSEPARQAAAAAPDGPRLGSAPKRRALGQRRVLPARTASQPKATTRR